MSYLRNLFVFGVLGLVPGIALRAQAVDDPQVEALFQQLSADDSRTREAARKRLIQRGDDIVAQLEALAETSNDPETRSGVAAVLDGIDAGSLTRPSLITVDLRDVPAAEAIRRIGRQAHADVRIWSDWADKQPPDPQNPQEAQERKTVTYKSEHQPFWKVMRELLPQLGLEVGPYDVSNRFVLTEGDSDAMKGPAYFDGPCMVVAESVTETKRLRFADPRQVDSNVAISLQVFIEPKVAVMSRASSPIIEKFVDDAGHSLLDEAEQRGRIADHQLTTELVSREAVFEIEVPANAIAERTRKVATLKGYLPILVQTGSERLELPDPLKAKGTTSIKGGWKIMVRDFIEDQGAYTFKFEVKRSLVQRLLGQHTWNNQLDSERIWLLDADGRPLSRSGETLDTDDSTWTGEITFTRTDTPAGPPAKLVWEFTTKARELRIPFEFKDLPLP
jgi:hypothetical protein